MRTLEELYETHDRLSLLHDHNSDSIGMLWRDIEEIPVIHYNSVGYSEYADMDLFYELTAEIDELEAANAAIDEQLAEIDSQIDLVKSLASTGA